MAWLTGRRRTSGSLRIGGLDRAARMVRPLIALAALAGLVAVPTAAQLRTVTLGQGSLTWESGGGSGEPVILTKGTRARLDTGNAPGRDIEFVHRAGWISPRFYDGTENIASLVLEGDGYIKAPNSLNMLPSVLIPQLEGTVNGDHEVAFVRRPSVFQPDMPAFGIWIYLDFARLVGVERIRFYPRNTVTAEPKYPYENDFLRAFEVWVNDRETNVFEGAPDALVRRVTENDAPIVDIALDPRYLRLIKLRSLTDVPFEIDEIEVYGSGYLNRGDYYTDLIDLGDRATVGPIRWVQSIRGEEAFSQLDVRARTGDDDTPVFLARRVVGDGLIEPELIEVTAEEYWALERRERAVPDDDISHWSAWQTVINGEAAVAAQPRRYAQFHLGFEGRLADTREVDRLFFQYLSPPVADTLRGEVFPRVTSAEEPATFRYAVALRGAADVLGYDQLEVDSNTEVADIRNVSVNGTPVPFDVLFLREDGFRLSFPLVREDGAVLEFTFDLPIFRFGTTFSGRAINSRYPAVPQTVQPGQAIDFGPGDFDELSGLAVAIPTPQIGKLVGQIALSTRVLTPNGDGIHDELRAQFNLLQLLEPAPVSLEFRDLSGRRVRRIGGDALGIGPAQLRWDGADERGELVAPGTYIWVMRVQADAFEERHHGTVAVAY